MSEFSGGGRPPEPFNIYNTVHRGQMPTLEESLKKNFKTLRTAFFTHPSDSEKYFIIGGENIQALNVFEVQEGLELISKEDFKTVTRLNSGDILVQTASAEQIHAIKSTTLFGTDKKPVTISENGVLNRSQATIKCREIMKMTEQKICENLRDKNVIGVQRMKRLESGKWVDTPTHILTFNSPIVPAKIKVGFINAQTEIFIPSPFRCSICQKIGHTRKRCNSKNNKPKCIVCGLDEPHKFFKPCFLPKCVNCAQQHLSSSKNCPRYIEERAINAIRVSMRIPYNLARNELRN
ncbi:hypothetical protein DMENIID0001_038800 [Sergentomyia squamirostris]